MCAVDDGGFETELLAKCFLLYSLVSLSYRAYKILLPVRREVQAKETQIE